MWGLRVMGPGLAVVVVGLITLLRSKGAGLSILGVGMGIYLVGVVITVVGIVLVYREAPSPRPNFIWLRWSLLHDAVHARPASPEQVAEGTALAQRHVQSPPMEALRLSAHWRLAVWAARVIGPGLAVVIAGLIALLWSTAAGIAILAGGLAIYFVAVVFSFVEVHRAYSDLQPPRPDYARVRQTLLHDALHAQS